MELLSKFATKILNGDCPMREVQEHVNTCAGDSRVNTSRGRHQVSQWGLCFQQHPLPLWEVNMPKPVTGASC